MSDIATPEFLSSLKALYPTQPTYVENPWYIVAANAFTSSNRPEAVPRVLQYVLADLDAIGATHGDKLAAARRMRDAVFKSALICGFPKIINALIALHEATPPELQDKETLRNPDPTITELADAGNAFFRHTYGNTADNIQNLITTFPDLDYFTIQFAYGYVYAFTDVTSKMETSLAMIAALIANDTPRQLGWHLQGALRNGATPEQVRAVRAIGMAVAKKAGIEWKHDVSDLD